jgi:ATP-dependent DNA ligase
MLSTKLRLFPDHRGGAASSARGEAPFYQRSIIDGEAVACDDNGLASFERIRYRSRS